MTGDEKTQSILSELVAEVRQLRAETNAVWVDVRELRNQNATAAVERAKVSLRVDRLEANELRAESGRRQKDLAVWAAVVAAVLNLVVAALIAT